MAIVDTLCCAVRNFLDVEVCELTDVEFLEPVVLPETGAIDTRVTLEVSTRSVLLEVAAAKVWQPVARATFQRAGASPITSLVLETNPVPDDFYSGLDAAGLSYGASFARLRGWRIHGGQVDVEIAPLDGCPAAQRRICESDAILHGVAAMISGAARAQVPRRIGRLRSSGEEGIRGASLVRLQAGERSTQVGVTAVSQDGRPILLMNDLVLRSLPSQASPELYWEEVMVPTGLMDRGPVLAPAIAGHKRTPGAAPTDRDIVRAALGGRLAWDLGMAEGAGSGTDLRRDVAQEWLLERGLARAADSGLAPLQDCPWPALDEMLRLVGESARSSSDELFAALLAATEGERQRRRPLSRCRRVAAGLLGDAEGARSARILIAGDIDGELLALACERAGYATIVATDRTTRAEIRSMLAPGSAVRIVTLQDVGDTERFDIILGVSLLRSCSQTDINRFAGIARRSGEILLVDEMPDLFALMTYAYDDPGAMADALGPFISATSGFQQFSVASDECIVLHHGTGLERDAARTSVSGTETAERLSEELTTRLGVETSGRTRTVVLPAHATLSQRFEAIRSAADGVEGTTWIIDPVDADFEELTGWRRVACNETGADVRVLSAAPGISVDQIATTLSSTTEQEIRLAPDGSFAPRLVPVRLEDRKTTEPRYKLVADRAGASRGLRWESVPRRKPEAGEVEIEVSTIGLNFRDVMLAQGLLPDEAFEGGFAGRNLGIECSGIVARVPEGSSFAEGDRVAAFADGAFASHVTLPQPNVIKLPDNVDLFDAATIPVAFLTADYAIRECARLQRGETVLIHGGAGAVGLAAIRIALSMGLRVFATAGTPEKRLFLKAQGVEGVFDSRSTDFADAILAATGSGVDSVVNSLSGEFLHRSLDCLAKFGRFVELGKRDIFANSHLGLRVLRNNISFFAVDADQLVADKPQVAGRILDRLSDELSDGRLTPLPFRAFPSNDIDAAFRLMQRAGHIGKIVVDAPKPPARSAPTTTLSIGGTWVVTGGSRGFGLETAKWLARQGAQVLWLVSRSGALDDDARTELETHGTKVKVIALDVTDRDRLTGLMDRIEKEGEGLTGVVHAAMVLEDGRLDDMDDAGVERVIAPKLGGARALDAATRRFEVEHFWLFSSVAARFGNPGQGPYVAGNRAIEALAASRGRDGLPALAVAWGPIADAGYLSRKAELRSVIDRQVGRLLSAKEALEAFQRFLEAGPGRSAITIAPMDWQKMRRSMPVLDGPLADLLDIGEPGATQEEVNLEELIAEVGLDRARERVIGMLRTEIAHLLRIPEDDIDPTRPLSEMGFDSLLAVQLKLAVEDRLHLEMPVNALGASVTLAHLVDVLFGERSGEQDRVAAIMAERHLVNADISEDLRAEIVSVSSGGRVQ